MDTFLEYSLSKQNHEEIENPNRWITSKKIETVIKYFSENKNLPPDTTLLQWWIPPKFRKDLMSILFKLLQNLKRRKCFISWGQHFPDTKTRQRPLKKRKLRTDIIDEHKYKNPQQNISKPSSVVHWKDHVHYRVESRITRVVQHLLISQYDMLH